MAGVMGRNSSALDFSTGYKVAHHLLLKLQLEMKPGRLCWGKVGLTGGGGPELCYLFVADLWATEVTVLALISCVKAER